MEKCGYRTGLLLDASRPNWNDDGHRPVAWSAWYPTDDPSPGGQPSGHLFDLGEVARDAALKDIARCPVVLLSHGTGGTAESLGWLARALAQSGHIVLAANHHGNTGLAPHHPAGFLCWWERATDLTFLLTSSAQTGFFADRLDLDRVSAVGFSLGGHTVMALAGARTSLAAFDTWRHDNSIAAGGPKEFPDAADHIPDLLRKSPAFRHSWARHGDDVSDDRVRAVVAIAPAPPVRGLTAPSVARLDVAVTLLTGGGDTEAPSQHCAHWLLRQNKAFAHHDLGPHVGHYTFLERPTDAALEGRVDIFTDHASVDRQQVHDRAATLVLRALT